MARAGKHIQEAFHIAFENVYVRLLVQSAGSELFEGDIVYNLASDSIEGITGLNTDRLNDLETAAIALSTNAEKEIFRGDEVRMIEFTWAKPPMIMAKFPER